MLASLFLSDPCYELTNVWLEVHSLRKQQDYNIVYTYCIRKMSEMPGNIWYRCLMHDCGLFGDMNPQNSQNYARIIQDFGSIPSLSERHVQQVEATDCAFAAVTGRGVVAWGLPPSGGRVGINDSEAGHFQMISTTNLISMSYVCSVGIPYHPCMVYLLDLVDVEGARR